MARSWSVPSLSSISLSLLHCLSTGQTSDVITLWFVRQRHYIYCARMCYGATGKTVALWIRNVFRITYGVCYNMSDVFVRRNWMSFYFGMQNVFHGPVKSLSLDERCLRIECGQTDLLAWPRLEFSHWLHESSFQSFQSSISIRESFSFFSSFQPEVPR